jgi:hypothetical protein
VGQAPGCRSQRQAGRLHFLASAPAVAQRLLALDIYYEANGYEANGDAPPLWHK